MRYILIPLLLFGIGFLIAPILSRVENNAANSAGAPLAKESEPAQTPASRTPSPAAAPGVLSLVGALPGSADEFNQGAFGDVAGFENLAFVGKWGGLCSGAGVDIIDISRPEAPVFLSNTSDHPNTAMEDVQAMRIGSRDVLAIGLQSCGNLEATGRRGLELVDITDPRNPETLALFDLDPVGRAGGVHEFDLTQTPGGRPLALLAVPELEESTVEPSGKNGKGDLIILDISDPAKPTLLAEWGILDEPSLGPDYAERVRQGGDARYYLHSVRASADGARAYLSYWDAGVIILDINDPAKPVLIGRTDYAPGQEGNAHSVAEAANGNLLIQADEDFSPFVLEFTSSALAENQPATEMTFSARLADLPGDALSGDVVHVGRGCPAAAGSPEDAYLADPKGKIALIERGVCRFDLKVARAQRAGAIGAIVYNNENADQGRVRASGERRVTLADGATVDINIPAVFVERPTGTALANADPPATARMASVFNGWGFLRFFDIRDPAKPIELATFATPNTNNESVAREGVWSVHNPEVLGDTLFASWYNDGIRVIDITDPSAPREIASWTGQDAPSAAPPVDIWSVVPHNGLLLASDRNFGLYILKWTP